VISRQAVGAQALMQQLVNSLFSSSVYALFALGFALVAGVLEVWNFAHGAVYMLTAVATYMGCAPQALRLVPLVLSAAELEELEKIPEARWPQILLECWVHKEALLKATGEGLGRDLRQVPLPLVRGGPRIYRRDGIWWGVCGLDIGPEHTGAVAVRECVPRLRRRSLAHALI
jgi:hypothetical protein